MIQTLEHNPIQNQCLSIEAGGKAIKQAPNSILYFLPLPSQAREIEPNAINRQTAGSHSFCLAFPGIQSTLKKSKVGV